MNHPKILFLDLETSPLLANIWRIFQENVGVNQLERERDAAYILSFTAMWMHKKGIIYRDKRGRRQEDDYELVRELRELLDQADFVVAHNGRDFDVRVLNSRIAFHRIPKPSSYRIIDTLIIAKRCFKLPSYTLEYLCQYFNKKYFKTKSKKFPGFELWKECLNDNEEAWEEMKKYNKTDVLALRELYVDSLMKWDEHTNWFNYMDDVQCPICGCKEYVKNGVHKNQNRLYQRYRCKNEACWYEWRDTRCLRSVKFAPTVCR